MKKIFLPVLFLVGFTTLAQEISPKQVIENYITAIGGAKAVSEIKDFSMEMEGEVQGQSMSMSVQKKLPNKFFTSVVVDGMGEVNKIIFNGTKGSVSQMGNEQILEGDEAKALEAQSNIIGELEYLKDLSKLSYEGKENVEGKDCHILKIINAMGEGFEYYDVESGLKIRQKNETESPMGKMTIVVDYKDYKEIDGVKFPHQLKQDMGMMAFDINVKSIKINQNLEDNIFELK
jgi:zinc protease